MNFNAPKNHYQIVNDLLKGKFITWGDNFNIIKEQEDYYKDFFKQSFDYNLIVKQEFAYLLSENTDEKFSRKLTVVMAILCQEWHSQNKDLKDAIEETFSISEIEDLLNSSTQKDILKIVKLDTGIERFWKNDLANRNIIKLDTSNDTFKFTPAISLFFEFAEEIAQNEINNIKE